MFILLLFLVNQHSHIIHTGCVHRYYESRRRLHNDCQPSRKQKAEEARSRSHKQGLRRQVQHKLLNAILHAYNMCDNNCTAVLEENEACERRRWSKKMEKYWSQVHDRGEWFWRRSSTTTPAFLEISRYTAIRIVIWKFITMIICIVRITKVPNSNHMVKYNIKFDDAKPCLILQN